MSREEDRRDIERGSPSKERCQRCGENMLLIDANVTPDRGYYSHFAVAEERYICPKCRWRVSYHPY